MTEPALDMTTCRELWRMFPHSYAERLSKCTESPSEQWIAYDYLKVISRKIAQKVAQGGGKLIVEVPPRHGKSTLISLWTPIWFLDLFPHKKVMLATYAAEFSSKWGRQVRNEIQSNPGVQVTVASDSAAAGRWDTTAGGGMVTAGIGGPVTGKGGHLIIIDDPVKNWEEASSPVYRQRNIDWMKSTMRTRAEPGCVIVVLQTRWHEGDLAGALQAENLGYEVIRFPAIAEANDPLGRPEGAALCPERYDEDDLASIKRDVGTKFWNALYQQRPSPEEGDVFKRQWWQFYDRLPDDLKNWQQSWDMSFKDKKTSDYVAGFVMAQRGADIYLIDRVKDKLSFTNSTKAVISLKNKWPKCAKILIEDKANGTAIIDVLKRLITGVIAVDPQGGKESRAYAAQPMVESGNVYLPNPEKNSWVSDFIEECAMFPNGKNDDQVDAFTQGVLRFKTETQESINPVAIFKSSTWKQ